MNSGHKSSTEELLCHPVNYTSRSWTSAESAYNQTDRNLTEFLTGMHMSKMYTLRTSIKVVTDHKSLVKLYGNPGKTKQLRIERHWIKLLAFQYHVTCESGAKTECDYVSWPSPKQEYTDDLFVNTVTEELLPQVATMQMIQTEFAWLQLAVIILQ